MDYTLLQSCLYLPHLEGQIRRTMSLRTAWATKVRSSLININKNVEGWECSSYLFGIHETLGLTAPCFQSYSLFSMPYVISMSGTQVPKVQRSSCVIISLSFPEVSPKSRSCSAVIQDLKGDPPRITLSICEFSAKTIVFFYSV